MTALTWTPDQYGQEQASLGDYDLFVAQDDDGLWYGSIEAVVKQATRWDQEEWDTIVLQSDFPTREAAQTWIATKAGEFIEADAKCEAEITEALEHD